jgi:hypothetical protein
MALKVKDAASSAAKFVARAQAAGGDYAKGVAAAGDSWQSKAAASGDAYSAGVQAAIGAQRFQKGIAKAGAAKYVANASGKGAQRYPSGVAAAGPNWQQNTQPYLDTLASLTLPPRHPRGDPGNLQRVAAVATALRAKKVGA